MKKRLILLFVTLSIAVCSLFCTSITALGATDDLSISATVSSETVGAGENVHISAEADGGQGDYLYRFLSRDKSGKMTVIKNFGQDDFADVSFDHAGTYQITAVVKDSVGKCTKKVLSVDVLNPLTIEASVSSNDVSNEDEVTITAQASGGEKEYKYRFFYRDNNNKLHVLQNYSSNNTLNYTFDEPGYYKIFAVVRDAENISVKTEMSLTVTKATHEPLSVRSNISSRSILVGEKLHLYAQGYGGTAPYIYKFSYKTTDGKWIVVQNYSSEQDAEMTFNEYGSYLIIIGCADETRTYTENLYRITVRKDTGESLINTSRINNTDLQQGDTIRLSASATGGYLPYLYRYSCQYEGGEWTVLKDFGYSSSWTYNLSQKGCYRFKVSVSDGTSISDKYFSVTSSSTTYSYTIHKAYLMANPRWATVTLDSNVPYNSPVRIIKSSGNWIMVNYKGTVGWVYNLALYNWSNYYEVTTETLPIVADDIIFYYTKKVDSLFNYVDSMAYRSLNKDTLENMCVYTIKYHRGACYQRAALLYYLLKRAGYSVYRVDDGINDYAYGSPHNWVIIKMSYGWRHMDPTPVIGVPPHYLVKDSSMSPYFSWDRNKYPACY